MRFFSSSLYLVSFFFFFFLFSLSLYPLSLEWMFSFAKVRTKVKIMWPRETSILRNFQGIFRIIACWRSRYWTNRLKERERKRKSKSTAFARNYINIYNHIHVMYYFFDVTFIMKTVSPVFSSDWRKKDLYILHTHTRSCICE